MSEQPEVRVGTAEREAAQSELNEHFSQGRLEVPEFEERSSLVAGARTRSELDTVFHDLPRAPATVDPDAVAKPSQTRNWRHTVLGATPIAAVVLFFLLNGHFDQAWLVFLLVPLVGAILGGGEFQRDRSRRREQLNIDRRQH